MWGYKLDCEKCGMKRTCCCSSTAVWVPAARGGRGGEDAAVVPAAVLPAPAGRRTSCSAATATVPSVTAQFTVLKRRSQNPCEESVGGRHLPQQAPYWIHTS